MSSDDTAISLHDLGKCYQIYARPGDRLRQFVAPRLQRLARRPQRPYFHEFWALRHLSLEVQRGETIGIIGRNGSGKSTLLQIICGTLTPTEGTVQTRGRVAALLELGAGFNPEFSGRENVFMNAALFGLTHEQTAQRFDAIAAFADIGEFMEQPVKTYSSGMYVRLAFAVIAHVDADILVVDEALSVGDAVFTQKCMRFIRAFQERGTLLFVSHDMASVQNLCRTTLWMSGGELRQAGPTKDVVEAYLRDTLQEIYGNEARLAPAGEAEGAPTAPASAASASASASATSTLPPPSDLPGAPVAPPVAPVIDYGAQLQVQDNLAAARGWQTGQARIVSVALEPLAQPGADGASTVFAGGDSVRLVIRAQTEQDLAQPILGFIVKDRLGQDLFGENTLPLTTGAPRPVRAGQRFEAAYQFRLPMLPNGAYAVMASVADGDLHRNVQHHYLHDALIFHVASSKVRWGLVGIPFEKIGFEVLDE